MTRSDLISKSTPGEFCLAYHVEAATQALAARQNGEIGTARAYANIARAWLQDYITHK